MSIKSGGAWTRGAKSEAARGRRVRARESACVGVSASDRRRWIRLVERILQMWSLAKNDDRMMSNEPFLFLSHTFSLQNLLLSLLVRLNWFETVSCHHKPSLLAPSLVSISIIMDKWLVLD